MNLYCLQQNIYRLAVKILNLNYSSEFLIWNSGLFGNLLLIEIDGILANYKVLSTPIIQKYNTNDQFLQMLNPHLIMNDTFSIDVLQDMLVISFLLISKQSNQTKHGKCSLNADKDPKARYLVSVSRQTNIASNEKQRKYTRSRQKMEQDIWVFCPLAQFEVPTHDMIKISSMVKFFVLYMCDIIVILSFVNIKDTFISFIY